MPIGALLSGGVDSSLVVGLMARASSRPIKTFSIGFDEPAFDELDAAQAVARSTSPPIITSSSSGPTRSSVVDSLVEHFDEPFGDSSAMPTWYVSQMARRHVTVVLSGDGGDELFGGYDRYLPHPRVAAFDASLGAFGRRAAGAAWPLLPHGVTGKNFLRHVAQRPARPLPRLDQLFPARRDERAAVARTFADGSLGDRRRPPRLERLRAALRRCRGPAR